MLFTLLAHMDHSLTLFFNYETNCLNKGDYSNHFLMDA